MIKIEKTETYGWEAAIRGARNPLNSWDRMDSEMRHYVLESEEIVPGATALVAKATEPYISIGKNDLDLMMRLRNAGRDHRKYLRMIVVCVDITAPLYWWKECDTYKVGTVANSCSTMHKIQEKEFTLDDFSHEHLIVNSTLLFDELIELLNCYRNLFNETKDKDYWWQMIQLLPSSYNQKRTIMMNYEVLANQYESRKNHKLDEWKEYCKWIEALPYSCLITGEGTKNRKD